MSKSKLRSEISELAQVLADAIVKAINSHTLTELASLTERDARPPRREALPTPKETAGRKSAPATKSKVAPKKKAAPAVKKERIPPAEVRAAVVALMQSSKDWMKANAIMLALEKRPDGELLSRVIRTLLDEGHIAKRGATRNTEYQITASGLAL